MEGQSLLTPTRSTSERVHKKQWEYEGVQQ